MGPTSTLHTARHILVIYIYPWPTLRCWSIRFHMLLAEIFWAAHDKHLLATVTSLVSSLLGGYMSNESDSI